MTRILVTAARGKTGREVATQLASRQGVEVCAASREPEALAADVRAVRFDWHDRDSWQPALDGVGVIYLVRPEFVGAPELVSELLSEAGDIEHVVLLSELGVEELDASTWEARVERAVTDNAKSWTLLRPNWFSQVLTDEAYYLGPIRAGTIELATNGAGVGFVDTRDIAAVAVESLVSRHAGEAYTLSGPAAVALEEVAAKLTAAIGRPVRYVDQSIDETLDLVFGGERDPFLLPMVEGVLERLCGGVYARLSDDIEQVCKREPRGIDAFIDEHVTLWRG